jgi:hypothetical protein
MPVQIEWLIQHHVIFTQYWGDVTADDIHTQYQRGIALCESSPAEFVHMIADVRNVQSFPMNINAYKGSFGQKAANAGWVVLVGNNQFMRFITTIISNAMHLHVIYFNDMDHALQHIAQRDNTAPYEQLQTSLVALLSSSH